MPNPGSRSVGYIFVRMRIFMTTGLSTGAEHRYLDGARDTQRPRGSICTPSAAPTPATLAPTFGDWCTTAETKLSTSVSRAAEFSRSSSTRSLGAGRFPNELFTELEVLRCRP